MKIFQKKSNKKLIPKKLLFEKNPLKNVFRGLRFFIAFLKHFFRSKISLKIIDFSVLNGKRKPRRFSLIRSLFAHRANGSLSFVRLLTEVQMEVIRLQRTKRICPAMTISVNMCFPRVRNHQAKSNNPPGAYPMRKTTQEEARLLQEYVGKTKVYQIKNILENTPTDN
jgi:hypothetical protein